MSFFSNNIGSVIHPSTSINTSAYTYYQVYASTSSQAIINNQPIVLAAGMKLNIPIKTITVSSGSVFCIGDKINVYNDTRIIGGYYSLTGETFITITAATEQTILSEPFGLNGLDGLGFPYYNPPSGWTSDPNNIFYGDNDIIPFCNVVGSSGTIFSILSNGNNSTDYTTTKVISTIGKTNIKLNFNEYRGQTTTPPPLILEYSPNNGSTWSAITWTETSTILSWVNSGDILLPIGAENKSQLKIRYGIVGNSSGELTAIDDFTVKATF